MVRMTQNGNVAVTMQCAEGRTVACAVITPEEAYRMAVATLCMLQDTSTPVITLEDVRDAFNA